jgi:hypothetical protein
MSVKLLTSWLQKTGEKLFIQETRFTPPHRTKKLYLPKYKHLEFDGSNIAHQLPAERVFPSTSNKGVLISKIREIALRLQIKMFPTTKIQANDFDSSRITYQLPAEGI